MPHLDRDADIYLLHLGDGENKFEPGWTAAVDGLLAEVAAAEGPRALVTRADGKFWSTGLDLDWIMAHPDETDGFLRSVQRLLARLLALPAPTVAAVQGHAFGMGAMFAAAHDQCVMRADRGYWCLPEVDFGLEFTAGLGALVAARLPVRVAPEAMTTGRRYGGREAVAAGIADVAADEGKVVSTATAIASALAAKAGPVLGGIKAQHYAGVIALLREGPLRSSAS